MTRWTLGVLVGVALSVCVGACETPTAPAGWVAPKIITAELSDVEVSAGASFTVAGAASDDHEVLRVQLEFVAPNSERALVPCTDHGWEPGPLVTFEVTCTMPAAAPSGRWKVALLVGDDHFGPGPGGYCYCAVQNLSFSVVDGTTDLAAPRVVSTVVTPNPAPVGSPLTVEIRATDDHPSSRPQALYSNYGGPGTHTCTQISDTAVSTTERVYVFECPPETSPGDFHAVAQLSDEMGFLKLEQVEYQVVAPAP